MSELNQLKLKKIYNYMLKAVRTVRKTYNKANNIDEDSLLINRELNCIEDNLIELIEGIKSYE